MKIKRKAENGTEVVVRETATNLALPEEWEKSLATAAKDESAVEQPAMQAFSLRAGVLSYNGQPMPENKMRVIVMASAFENAYFISKFDPNNIVSPLCFALSENGANMAPHDNSYRKQNEECLGCPRAEWGSDENSPSGRGKACKEVRRLALIPEDALKDGITKAAVAMLRIPVTSVRNWAQYVHMLAATAKRPAWSVVTEVKVVQDPKTQIQVHFTPVESINDPQALAQLQSIRHSAQQGVMNPYALMTEEQFKEITEPKPVKRKF